jgi:hypothetical protein
VCDGTSAVGESRHRIPGVQSYFWRHENAQAAWLKDFFDFPETTQSPAFLAGLFFVS